MKSFSLSIVLCLLLTRPLLTQWTMIEVDTAVMSKNLHLSSLTLISNEVAYVAGCTDRSAWSGGALLRTTDGGTSWILMDHQPANCLAPIWFMGMDIGYTGGQSLMRTSDGGKTWATPDGSVPGLITTNALYFVNDTLGLIGGGAGLIGRTGDGGKTWAWIQIPLDANISAFFFTSHVVGYATSYDKSMLLKTTDGGHHWNMVTTDYPLFSVHFPSVNTGYAVGANATIIKTTDGGDNWILQTVPVASATTLRSISCLDNDNCYAVGDQGILLSTTDGGNTWQTVMSGTLSNLNVISCTPAGICYAAGDSMTLLKRNISTGIAFSAETRDNPLRIKPNPATQNITISYEPDGTDHYIRITDVQGRTLKEVDCTDRLGRYVLDRTEFSQGLFFCFLYHGGTLVSTTKFVFE